MCLSMVYLTLQKTFPKPLHSQNTNGMLNKDRFLMEKKKKNPAKLKSVSIQLI